MTKTVGHNSGSVDSGHLKAFVERIERLSEDKDTISEDIREVFQELKSSGYDVKVIRKIVAMRKQDEQKRREFEEILDLYCAALGMN